MWIIPPNFRLIDEILKELERERRSGRTNGWTDAMTDDNTPSAPMASKGKNGVLPVFLVEMVEYIELKIFDNALKYSPSSKIIKEKWFKFNTKTN